MQDKEYLEYTKNRIKKLVFLIEESSMPGDVKVSWVKLLPEMSVEQIDTLFDIVEAEYIGKKTGNIDNDLEKKLASIMGEFDQKEKDIDKKYEDKLAAFSDKLNV